MATSEPPHDEKETARVLGYAPAEGQRDRQSWWGTTALLCGVAAVGLLVAAMMMAEVLADSAFHAGNDRLGQQYVVAARMMVMGASVALLMGTLAGTAGLIVRTRRREAAIAGLVLCALGIFALVMLAVSSGSAYEWTFFVVTHRSPPHGGWHPRGRANATRPWIIQKFGLALLEIRSGLSK